MSEKKSDSKSSMDTENGVADQTETKSKEQGKQQQKSTTTNNKNNNKSTSTNNYTHSDDVHIDYIPGFHDMSISSISDRRLMRKHNLIPGQRMVIRANGISYRTDGVIGHGSFGVVFKATVQSTGEVVAIKKVLQDRRFKNRELQIMRMLDHPNIVGLKNSFYTNGDSVDEVYLNLVLEFVPQTVYRYSKEYQRFKNRMPILSVKLYMYQLCRSLAYIHSLGICHRDIKPQNLLLNPQEGVLKLCDFGSAKVLVEGEPNVSYICSRYYRAPELIFGAVNYTTAIDLWSLGCVIAELLLGQPLFPGDSGVDQLVEIIKVLGTPKQDQIRAMASNQNLTEFRFPQIKGVEWSKVFRSRTPPDAVDLISKLLQYHPKRRITALEACAHPFFDELRNPETVLPRGKPLPPLFDFSDEELEGQSDELIEKLIPPHARAGANNEETKTNEKKEEEDEEETSAQEDGKEES